MRVYQSAFAEAPWDEFLKCGDCGTGYGMKEAARQTMIDNQTFQDVEYIVLLDQGTGNALDACKGCAADVKPRGSGRSRQVLETNQRIRPYWSEADVGKDLAFAQDAPKPIVLVADNGEGLAGFTWGYQMPLEKEEFSFLSNLVEPGCNYMDEIAVAGTKRARGVATQLGAAYLEKVSGQGIGQCVLRTDITNTASMGLFRKLGFTPLFTRNDDPVMDPTYPRRIYLQRRCS